jgi:hypothetical protein
VIDPPIVYTNMKKQSSFITSSWLLIVSGTIGRNFMLWIATPSNFLNSSILTTGSIV